MKDQDLESIARKLHSEVWRPGDEFLVKIREAITEAVESRELQYAEEAQEIATRLRCSVLECRESNRHSGFPAADRDLTVVLTVREALHIAHVLHESARMLVAPAGPQEPKAKCRRCGGSGYLEVGSGKGGCGCPECLGTGTVTPEQELTAPPRNRSLDEALNSGDGVYRP